MWEEIVWRVAVGGKWVGEGRAGEEFGDRNGVGWREISRVG